MECKTNLEELDSYDGKHKLKETRDKYNVANGFNGNNHTLHNMLETTDNNQFY